MGKSLREIEPIRFSDSENKIAAFQQTVVRDFAKMLSVPESALRSCKHCEESITGDCPIDEQVRCPYKR